MNRPVVQPSFARRLRGRAVVAIAAVVLGVTPVGVVAQHAATVAPDTSAAALTPMALTSSGPTTSPAAAAATPAELSTYAAKPLRRAAEDNADVSTPGVTADKAARPAQGLGATRVLTSLAIVLLIIFGLKFFGQKWFVAPGAVKARSRTVETLSRAMIGPKQQVLLLRVGKRRLLVVGDTGGTLTALDRITDADEVAELVAQVRSESTSPATAAFGSLFGKSMDVFASKRTARPADDGVDDEDDDAEASTDDRPAMTAEERSVDITRRDLDGLLAKVRGVSGRLG